MRIAGLLLVGVTAIPVTLSAQEIDSNTIESPSESGRRNNQHGPIGQEALPAEAGSGDTRIPSIGVAHVRLRR